MTSNLSSFYNVLGEDRAHFYDRRLDVMKLAGHEVIGWAAYHVSGEISESFDGRSADEIVDAVVDCMAPRGFSEGMVYVALAERVENMRQHGR